MKEKKKKRNANLKKTLATIANNKPNLLIKKSHSLIVIEIIIIIIVVVDIYLYICMHIIVNKKISKLLTILVDLVVERKKKLELPTQKKNLL